MAKRNRTIVEQMEEETDDILFNASMGMYPSVDITSNINDKTGWDNETDEEKQDRRDSEPDRWHLDTDRV